MSSLTVIVPVYNEAAHLGIVIGRLLSAPCPVPRQWIFIDDRSTDGSREILLELARVHGFQVILQKRNLGKGAAVRRGIAAATSEFLMVQDADLEYDPHNVPKLLQPLLDGRADVVYGSRFKKDIEQVHRTYHYFVNRFLTLLSNLLSGIYLTDMETCYKFFRTDLVQPMAFKSNRFGLEVEITAYVARAGARVHELPISYHPRTRQQGKKITWRDGVAALFHLVRFNIVAPPIRLSPGP